MRAKDSIPASKPRNPVVRQQQTSGAGAHRDKKKEQKQGEVKHKGKQFDEEAAGVGIVTKQNATADVPVGGEYMNVKKLFPKKKKVKEQSVAEGNVMEYETHRYTDDQGNEWEVNDEGERTLIKQGWGSSSRRSYYRPKPMRYSKPKGYYFYNVPPGREQDAKAAGLLQSKSGKWYSTMNNAWAEKAFGKGRYWEPKN